ncbi:hypothetical protein [Amycolatopsis nigrescens]|uniref:hypothetical protein n=1 Tax=Amycolatopsis nigrescens TaxID=381445 RepID=UPI0003740439|nr:hypothetical protein [Amycolatopsis nigrescens]
MYSESSTDTLEAPVDTETRLRELMSLGYQFIHPRDAAGKVIAVVGVRVHDTVIDVVRLNAEDDVVATRMPGTEADVLAPDKVLWTTRGKAPEVLDELLALPADRVPGSVLGPDDTPARGCWVSGSGGTMRWLSAS